MMTNLQEPAWLRDYLQLENAVRALVVGQCVAVCTVCRKPCCREEICRETQDSPWLAMAGDAAMKIAHGKNQKCLSCARPHYKEKTGWLTRKGCALSAGRPPVCYEFFCAALLAPLDATQRAALVKAGSLVARAGARALGARHLVELDEDQLRRVDPGRMRKKIQQARAMLEECRAVLEC